MITLTPMLLMLCVSIIVGAPIGVMSCREIRTYE